MPNALAGVLRPMVIGRETRRIYAGVSGLHPFTQNGRH